MSVRKSAGDFLFSANGQNAMRCLQRKSERCHSSASTDGDGFSGNDSSLPLVTTNGVCRVFNNIACSGVVGNINPMVLNPELTCGASKSDSNVDELSADTTTIGFTGDDIA
jgi:hypothetical protein